MVNVLMSTYNGENYLQEQLDSILAQQVECRILVRDDGSKDGTTAILDAYREKGQLDWYSGDNLGPARSFMQLLFDSYETDYYAFSDQDDYWKPEKLRVAVEMLEKHNDVPALYFCQTQLTDSQFNPLESVIIHPLLTFGESLVYEFVGGCTMVMNRALRDIVVKYRPAYLPMHDVWVYSVALAVGAKVFFDKTPYILYRQHGNNTIGQGQSPLHEWKRRWHRIASGEQSRYRRACEIRKGFAELVTEENRAVLDKFIAAKHSLASRVAMMTDKSYRSANASTNRLFKMALLLNTY